jgi:hypothetical protein
MWVVQKKARHERRTGGYQMIRFIVNRRRAGCDPKIFCYDHQRKARYPGAFGPKPAVAAVRLAARAPVKNLMLGAAFLLAACSNPGKTALGTAVPPLTAAPDLAGAATPDVMIWRSPDLAERERTASSYLVPPVTIYHGRGANFADLSPQQVNDIAAGLTREVRQQMRQHFKLVDAPGPNVFTLDLVLVNVTPPRPEYIGSGPYSVSALAVGMPDAGGMTAGTMTVAGKFIDSESGKLLVGFSAPVSPQVMDLAGPGNPARAYDFAAAASEQFAADLVHAIIRQRRNSQSLLSK